MKSLLDQYQENKEVKETVSETLNGNVKKAVPVVSSYREKFRTRTLTPHDLPKIDKRREVPVDVGYHPLLGEGPGLEIDTA